MEWLIYGWSVSGTWIKSGTFEIKVKFTALRKAVTLYWNDLTIMQERKPSLGLIFCFLTSLFELWKLFSVEYIACARKVDDFWNLKTSLPATLRFHTDSHRAQCCSEFSWHGNVSVCVNKFFHFALKHYFISKTVRCFWRILYEIMKINGGFGVSRWSKPFPIEDTILKFALMDCGNPR
jgi:hypothetical protein